MLLHPLSLLSVLGPLRSYQPLGAQLGSLVIIENKGGKNSLYTFSLLIQHIKDMIIS